MGILTYTFKSRKDERQHKLLVKKRLLSQSKGDGHYSHTEKPLLRKVTSPPLVIVDVHPSPKFFGKIYGPEFSRSLSRKRISGLDSY